MSTSDCSDQSGNEISEVSSTPGPPGPPSRPQNGVIKRLHTRGGVRQFLVVDHSANLRCGSKISAIWDYGGERRRLDDNSIARYWRCAHCKVATVLKVREGGGQTSYAIRHLKNKHGITLEEDKVVVPISSPSIFASVADLAGTTIAHVATKGYKSLVSTLDATRFRKALVMFFVQAIGECHRGLRMFEGLVEARGSQWRNPGDEDKQEEGR
jgi:hypothetical protein